MHIFFAFSSGNHLVFLVASSGFSEDRLAKGLWWYSSQATRCLGSSPTGRHPDSAQRCSIAPLRLGYIFVFLWGGSTLGFGEIGEAFMVSLSSLSCAVQWIKTYSHKAMENSSLTPKGQG